MLIVRTSQQGFYAIYLMTMWASTTHHNKGNIENLSAKESGNCTLEQVALRFRLPFKFGGNITSRTGTLTVCLHYR